MTSTALTRKWHLESAASIASSSASLCSALDRAGDACFRGYRERQSLNSSLTAPLTS